ncbi:hypothetical protein [Streptomyces camelliae]|uniref:Uncharacterized protein n=1 Tax=Streptomyces camelliae TaxID=3004093 RepID=A0ABY7PG03_9ACTN|nr:hypothetical protein [Streptomyces sp. HUAS 2-6]WBO68464.1 hypothetical protein O1G22_39435 [Streptomyces sp. HUAS 2-6]
MGPTARPLPPVRGREEQPAQISASLHTVGNTRRSKVLLVEARPGAGKTRLLVEAVTLAGAHGFSAEGGVLCGSGATTRAAPVPAAAHPSAPDAVEDPDADWRPGSEPGHRAAHAWWDAGTSTLDLFGHGFALLRFGEHGQLTGVERAFAERGVPLAALRGADREVAELYERSFVLVRPDGHVAWRGDELPRDPGVLTDTVRGDRAEPSLSGAGR